MKKTILLFLFGLLFLTGCGNKPKFVSLPPEPIIGPVESFENIFSPDTGAYPDPQIIITEGTGRLVKGLNGDDSPQKQYQRTKTKDENGEERLEATATGYIYIYIYKDLGIKITTSPLYPTYFYEIPKEPIFKRHADMIYRSGSSDGGAEYIQKLTKDPTISFYDQIKNKHTPFGCKIDLLTGYDYNFLKKPNSMISATFSDESPTGNTCIQGDIEFPKNGLLIIFLYNPKNPMIYYKVSLGDACAPGPCSIFGNIEFF